MSGDVIKVGKLEIRYLVDGADEGGCACASSPTVTPETTAIHAPDQSLHCIICLLLFGAWTARCNHQTETSTRFRVTERHQKPPRSGIRPISLERFPSAE